MRADNEMLIRELMTGNEDLNRRIGDFSGDKAAFTKRNDDLVADYESLRRENNFLTTRIDELTADNDTLRRQHEESISNVEKWRQQSSEMVGRVEAMKQRNDELVLGNETSKNENDALKRRIDELVINSEVLNSRCNDSARDLVELRSQLEQERLLRKAVEARLNRLLYGQFEGAAVNQSLSHLLLCCDRIPNVTLEEAVFGRTYGLNCLLAQLLSENCTEEYIRSQISINRTELNGMVVTRRLLSGAGTAGSSLTLEHLLAMRMYTFGNDSLKLYVAVNSPFYDPDRTTDSLANQLPFVRLLIRSLRALGRATRFETGVTVYRAVSVESSPYLLQVYNDFINNTSSNVLQPGILLRFPSFTSTSRTDPRNAADKFGDDFIYEIKLNHEVSSVLLYTMKLL
jgi:regulator of replication initiation timing